MELERQGGQTVQGIGMPWVYPEDSGEAVHGGFSPSGGNHVVFLELRRHSRLSLVDSEF